MLFFVCYFVSSECFRTAPSSLTLTDATSLCTDVPSAVIATSLGLCVTVLGGKDRGREGGREGGMWTSKEAKVLCEGVGGREEAEARVKCGVSFLSSIQVNYKHPYII